jgi:hypothetical protein|tara:strand:- start:81 stop:584 length:504 start_codon:yes stop_codon:yes gene_type:complete
MQKTPELALDAPIPGQSLTAPLGDRPWQNPPQLTTVDEAMDYYLPVLVNADTLPQLLNIMELGIPLTTIADSLMLANVMEGTHSADVGILIMPFLIEMMQFIGDSQEVDYVVEKPKSDKSPLPSFSDIAVALQRKEKKEPAAKEEEAAPAISDDTMKELKGLMARRK